MNERKGLAFGAGQTYQLFIDGRFVPAIGGQSFTVENPATGEILARVAEGGEADIDRAVQAARRAFESRIWSGQHPAERGTVLRRIAGGLRERLPQLVFLEVLQTGRPIRELQAQLARLPEWYEYFASVAETEEGRVTPYKGAYLNYIQRVPLGVVGQLTPWNHPLLILTKKVAPALAAGNSLVVKPSELAPLTALELAAICRESDLPDGVLNVVPGFGATAGRALAEHPGVAKIDLTGGTETGRTVAALASSHLAQFACELGGKASILIFPDADLDEAVAGAAFAAFIATGQTCVQGARLLVHREILEVFTELLVAKTRRIRLGDPKDPNTECGPLISSRQCQRTASYVELAQQEGATVAFGGAIPNGLERGHYYLPTVLTGMTNDMRVAQEEVFGPVTCILPFEDEEDGIRLANSTEFGLSMSVWTRDIKRAHRIASRLESGIVWINDHHRVDPASPWGGFKQSGIGRENGREAYYEYTQLRSVVVNLNDTPFDWYDGSEQAKRYS